MKIKTSESVADTCEGKAIPYTEFEETWTERTEGVKFDNSEDYAKKVNPYLTTHVDTISIFIGFVIINHLLLAIVRCCQ